MSSIPIIILTLNVNILYSFIFKLVEMGDLKWGVSKFSSNVMIFIPKAKNAIEVLLKWLTELYDSILIWESHLSSKDQLENLAEPEEEKKQSLKIISLTSKTHGLSRLCWINRHVRKELDQWGLRIIWEGLAAHSQTKYLSNRH